MKDQKNVNKKTIGGLLATVKGGKHDGHEVRIQEKGIYCSTCDKFYPKKPKRGNYVVQNNRS